MKDPFGIERDGNGKKIGTPQGASELKAMLACKECGELEHIYFKHVYHGLRDSIWVVECQRCYFLVPVVAHQYDPEKMTAAWNSALKEDKP